MYSTKTLSRRLFLAGIAAMFGLIQLPTAALAGDAKPSMHVFKSPFCGCCGNWVDIVRAAGFNVTVTDVEDMDPVKRQAGISEDLESCHTAIVDGYIVEGHVPVPAIRKLLRERPRIRGLSVPGMPYGSPGMGVDPDARYDVVTIGSKSSPGGAVFYSVGK